jgi:hypothetical protein
MQATEVQLGIRIEVISIIWMVVEMAVSIGAGIAARSILLTAFGIDSLIELISGGILLWRLLVERREGGLESVERAEVPESLKTPCNSALIFREVVRKSPTA